MKRLLIIGCGDIARRTIPLLNRHYRICALIRNDAQREGLRALGVVPIAGDLDSRKRLSRIAGLADVVLHLAPPSSDGTHDLRTRRLLAALSQGVLPRRLIYISTSGVYGDCGGARVSETRKVNPQTARAARRVDAEQQVRDWASRNGVNASILRVPGIYAVDRLPLDRLRSGMPAIGPDEDSFTNHVHADDLARIIIAAMRHGRPNRVYHASDDGEMKMGDYFDAVADAYRLPRPARVSRAEAQRMLPASMLSFMNESRRLVNGRMKRELKVGLMFPTVSDLLQKN
jgi:nucleoside-diphosphate-sugar epimerase